MHHPRNDILIADDEESICFGLARAVKQRGFQPRVVADGRAAVELAHQRRDHLRAAFLDVRMPRLSGLEALAEIRDFSSTVPCCLMTAYAKDSQIAARLAGTGVPVLDKPFDLAAFMATLDALLATPPAVARRTPVDCLRIVLAFPQRFSFGSDVIRGAMRYARNGRDWLVSIHHEEDVAVALAEEPDGVITMAWSADTVEKLLAWGGPVVDAGPNVPERRFARVGLANETVGAVAAEYLMSLGPRRMAIIVQPPAQAAERIQDGFVRRLAQSGIGCEVASAERFHWPTPASAPHLGQLADWIRTLPLPAAVFAAPDPLAFRVSEACWAAGLRIPEDVAVLGMMNDRVACESANPPLSSVRVAGEAVGAEAARLLEHMMDGGLPPAERVEFAPLGIAVRASTDTTAVADPALATALRFLRERLADPIGVDDVVEVACVSRSSLERRFRAAFGHGPLAELLRLRVERAKQLLAETDHTLGEIALACGFREARRLAVVFREKTGITPTTFRSRHCGGRRNSAPA